jgi:hypothetical protein
LRQKGWKKIEDEDEKKTPWPMHMHVEVKNTSILSTATTIRGNGGRKKRETRGGDQIIL